MVRRLAACFVAGAFISAGIPALGQPTGLIVIPIAETVGAGRMESEVETEGTLSQPASDELSFNTEFGLGPRAEAGIDFIVGSGEEESRVLLNSKYTIARSGRGATAFAAGIEDLDPRFVTRPFRSASLYVVLSRELGRVRLHSGAAYRQNGTHWFAGADHCISDRFRIIAEHTNGRESLSAFGASYEISDRIGLQLGVEVPNDGGDALLNVQLELE